jgi:hypothetical protein
MDQSGAFEAGAVPFSQPSVGVAPSFDAAVFADRRVVGRVNRVGPGGLRHSFAEAHQADADLPADQKSPGGSAIARSQQTRKHGQIPGIEVDDALEIAEQTEV